MEWHERLSAEESNINIDINYNHNNKDSTVIITFALYYAQSVKRLLLS